MAARRGDQWTFRPGGFIREVRIRASLSQAFFRAKKNRWYVQLDRKHVNLGPDEPEAFHRYHALMAVRGKTPPVIVETTSDPSVVSVLDAFLRLLEDSRCHRSFG